MRSRKIGWIVLAMALWGVPRAFAQQERAECADPAGELGIGELRCSSGRCLRGWAVQGGRLITTFTTEPSVHTLRPPADSVLEDVVRPIFGLLFLVAATALLFADGLRRVQGWGPVWTSPGSMTP